jgi:hypothetical protein
VRLRDIAAASTSPAGKRAIGEILALLTDRRRTNSEPEEALMDVTDVWVANDEGTEIVRARDIAAVSLDYDGNVTVRLTGGDGAVVTIAGHRTHHEEHRPDDFHRQLARAVAELSDAAGAFLVRAAHDETRGWQWISEPL